ncbi:hypothetical protein ACHHYP_09414 [Achlya hypogyna]|uniref:Secreted protein n=1 Tax=Achlya hypogyna TaxID=1202772 RepID=A0A0A7CNZ9_ACHHY|nr:secreted protein [Achlya hypogyna]OQR87179.1 hypothetical protein ACHHYP_09414 [Achlya hypogyna]
MKATSLVAYFLCAVAVLANDDENCVSKCQSHTARQLERVCIGYRDRLPRPTLYNNCVDAYRLGSRESCAAYCNVDQNADSHLMATLSTACEKYRTIRPKDSQQICEGAFRSAVLEAKAFIKAGTPEPVEQPASTSGSQATAPAKADKKPEIKIKDIKVDAKGTVDAKPKSVLEAAREEALAAAKASRDL